LLGLLEFLGLLGLLGLLTLLGLGYQESEESGSGQLLRVRAAEKRFRASNKRMLGFGYQESGSV
jgi:hypothetical protein